MPADVEGDADEPGTEALRIPESVEPQHRLQARLLDGVLGELG